MQVSISFIWLPNWLKKSKTKETRNYLRRSIENRSIVRTAVIYLYNILTTERLEVRCSTVELYFEGGVRVCGDAVLRYFWCGFSGIFILTCGIAVL